MTALAFSFLAGLLTVLSPCVLPLAPIVVAAARAESAAGPLALAAGLTLGFGLVGGALAAAGVEAGDSPALRTLSALALAFAGAALLWPRLQTWLEHALSPMGRLGSEIGSGLPRGAAGQAALGVTLSLAWAPCAGPTLGAAFALAAQGGSRGYAMLSMAVYALGAASALLAAGFGLGRLAVLGRARTRAFATVGRMAFGATLLAVGVGIVTGLDHLVEARAVAAMPEWLTIFATRL